MSEKPSLLWLSHMIPYPPKAGLLSRSFNLLKELAKDADIDLLALHQPRLMAPMFDSMERGIAEAESTLNAFCRSFQWVSISGETYPLAKERTYLTSVLKQKPYAVEWFRSSQFQNLVKKAISATKYDYVFFDTIGLMQYAGEINDGPLKVLTHHNIESHLLRRRADQTTSRLEKLVYGLDANKLEKYEKKICRQVDLNIVCSELDAIRMSEVQVGADNIDVKVVPNGVDVEYFGAHQTLPESHRALFFGTLDWHPNISALRYICDDIWPLLSELDSRITFDIAGSRPPAFAESLSDQDDRFNVLGFVEDIRQTMSEARVFVCPITDGGGTKLKVLDAMAFGLPIVAHPIAIEGIDLVDGESVLLAETPSDFVAAISKVLFDTQIAEGLATRARDLAQAEYGYASITKDLLAYLRQRAMEAA